MDSICDNNNTIDILKVSCLINATFDSEKFSFSRSDINCMMNCLGQNILTRINMQNRSSDIVFNIDIRNDNDSFRIYIGVFNDFVEFLKVDFHNVFISAVNCMEQKTIRKIIY